jgi:hypothetical protein
MGIRQRYFSLQWGRLSIDRGDKVQRHGQVKAFRGRFNETAIGTAAETGTSKAMTVTR